MATEKRDRQRANREVKKAAEEKAAKKASTMDRAKKIALWVGLLIVALVIANLVFGGNESDVASLAL